MQHVFQSEVFMFIIYVKHVLQDITNATERLTVTSAPFYALSTLQATVASPTDEGTARPKGRSNMSGFDWGAFFLLGVDSLIACIVTGPMFIRQRPQENSELRSPDEEKRAARQRVWVIAGLSLSVLTVPYGISYGVGDGLGYLLGTLFHFSISDSLSSDLETTLLVVLGLYWIAIYFAARRMQGSDQLQKWSWSGIWVLPVALSIDNLTFGAVTGIPANESVWASAGLQALASAALGLVGLVVGIGLAVLIPGLRSRMYRTFGIVGVGVIATAGILLYTGW
jgi:hypothetical protein